MLPSSHLRQLSDKRTGWCAGLILLCLIPLFLAANGLANTLPGPGGARWAPFLGFLASYAVLIVVDLVTIGVLFHALRKKRVRTPSHARRTIWLAAITLVAPAVYLGYV